MRKAAITVLFTFLALLVTGCSTIDDFFVVNSSDSVLEVSVKWRENLYSGLRRYKFERFDGKRFERLEMANAFSPEEIGVAEEKNEIRVLLEPREILRVHGVLNESRESIAKAVDSSFRIEFLSLKGKRGTVELTGDQVWYQFHEMDQGYFLVYR